MGVHRVCQSDFLWRLHHRRVSLPLIKLVECRSRPTCQTEKGPEIIAQPFRKDFRNVGGSPPNVGPAGMRFGPGGDAGKVCRSVNMKC